jgi:hypothetical protein
MRRRFTRQIATASFSVVLKAQEHEVFKTFFDGELQSGVRWFTMNIFTGEEYQEHAVRFLEVPSVSNFGFRHVKLSTKVELKRLQLWSIEAAWLLGEYGAEFLIQSFADPLQVIVNEDWPGVTEDY